ncbi:MAG: HDOD domain-containing protein [Deltaproteobacteria bacterium]|nr:HDOD domain-containing protein [Deltaproteobacteria bacterium]
MFLSVDRENGHVLREIVKTMVSVIEEKDRYLKGHSERVATKCVNFSKRLGLPQKMLEKIYLAGLLHDIGMVYIPEEITRKPFKLDETEMLVMKQHPIISEKILSKHAVFKGILSTIRHHHEAYDGSGYPDSLKGNEIPVETGILSIVNTYEAMVSARAHRPSFTAAEALDHIKINAGRLFEKNLANAFIAFMAESPSEPASPVMNNGDQTARDIVIGIVQKMQGGKIDLPVLPKVVQKIQKVMSQNQATVDDIARVIEKDAVISVRLIHVANSAMYRGTSKIFDVKQVIPRLGVKETQGIVTTIANKSLYQTKNEQFVKLMENLWLHSLACANASRRIGKQLRIGDSDKLFLMGLLHDIGKPPLIKLLTESFPKNNATDMDEIIESIQEVHASFGGALLKSWGFEQDISRVAIRHEGPTFPPDIEKEILIVNLANNLVRNLGYGLSENGQVDLSSLDSAKMLDVDTAILDRLGKETEQSMLENAQIF